MEGFFRSKCCRDPRMERGIQALVDFRAGGPWREVGRTRTLTSHHLPEERATTNDGSLQEWQRGTRKGMCNACDDRAVPFLLLWK